MRRSSLVVLLAASSILTVHAQRVRPDAARIATMHEHLRHVDAIQAAVVAGDLVRLQTPLRILKEMTVPPGLPDAASRHVGAIADAAGEAAAATSVAGAATAAARMFSSCGNCHRAVGTMPAVGASQMPTVGGTVGHMLDHQRAVDQLLRGLIIPSNSEWTAGARALRAAPLHADHRPRDVSLAPELLRIEEAVHRLAEEATGAESAGSRIRVYSTLLARCADCHSLHARAWGPRQR